MEKKLEKNQRMVFFFVKFIYFFFVSPKIFLYFLDVARSKLTKLCSPKNYNQQKYERAKQIFALYNKIVFNNKLTKVPVIWKSSIVGMTSSDIELIAGLFKITKLKESNCCYYVSEIQLSEKYLTDPELLRTSLLHEMCHAAAWVIDNVYDDDHGEEWQKW